jgi:hypothetical protein
VFLRQQLEANSYLVRYCIWRGKPKVLREFIEGDYKDLFRKKPFITVEIL